MSTDKLLIHQVVHGYNDGHRQLQTSCKLPAQSQRIMLMLSDMSGPTMIEGFEEYVTGYPLIGTDYYAFAKTWVASEMERPGCVWTHTLLLNKQEMGKMRSNVLINCFQRPTKSLDSNYNEPIVYKYEDQRSNINAFCGSPLSKIIIYKLYGLQPDTPIVLLSSDSRTYEKFVSDVWLRQPSHLRNVFSFCTGSLSNRSINGNPFDLQIAPPRVLNQIKRESTFCEFIQDANSEENISFPEWVDTIHGNLVNARFSSELNEFLHACDSEIDERRVIPHYLNIFNCINKIKRSEATVETLLQLIAGSFPESSQAKLTKSQLLGGPEYGISSLNFISDFELLSVLSMSDSVKCLSKSDLHIKNRVQSIWRNNRNETIDLISDLIRNDINIIGEEILKSIAEIISSREMLECFANRRQVILVFAAFRPILISGKGFWCGSIDEQKELLCHLMTNKHLALESSQSIIGGILDAGCAEIADEVHRSFGSHSVDAILDWIDQRATNLEDMRLNRWVAIIAIEPSHAMHWLSDNLYAKPKTISLILSKLDSNATAVQSCRIMLWSDLIDVIMNRNDFQYEDTKAVAEFLLPLALKHPCHDSIKLIEFSFKIVHDAIAKSEVSYESWQRLDPLLPGLPWYRSWDRCERLRRGVKRYFEKMGISDDIVNKLLNKQN